MVVVVGLFVFWLALQGRLSAYAALVTTKGTDDYLAALNAALKTALSGIGGSLSSTFGGGGSGGNSNQVMGTTPQQPNTPIPGVTTIQPMVQGNPGQGNVPTYQIPGP
jgi:hypothetical protein